MTAADGPFELDGDFPVPSGPPLTLEVLAGLLLGAVLAAAAGAGWFWRLTRSPRRG